MRAKEKESTRRVSERLTVRVCNRDYSVRAIPNVKPGEMLIVRRHRDGERSGVAVEKYDEHHGRWRVFPAPLDDSADEERSQP